MLAVRLRCVHCTLTFAPPPPAQCPAVSSPRHHRPQQAAVTDAAGGDSDVQGRAGGGQPARAPRLRHGGAGQARTRPGQAGSRRYQSAGDQLSFILWYQRVIAYLTFKSPFTVNLPKNKTKFRQELRAEARGKGLKDEVRLDTLDQAGDTITLHLKDRGLQVSQCCQAGRGVY